MRLRLAALKGIAALFATSIAMTGASYADTFNFTSCHISDGTDSGDLACPAPGTVFGTVTLTASGSGVLFDVVLNFGSRFVETGAGGDMLFAFTDNVAGSTITNITATLGGVTVSVPAGGLSGSTNLAPFQADGTGNFTAGVFCTVASQCNGGSTPTFDDLHFTVTNATIAQLTTANAKGNIFIADILCGSNEALTACNGLTGPVDVSSVPGPVVGAGLPGLIAAASGLIALARRRRQKLV